MALSVLETIRNGWLNSVQAAIDNGSGAGKVKFYTGVRPATGVAITDQVLLGAVTCADPCAAAAAAGVLTFNVFVDDTNAAASGDASWARITDSDDNFVADASVGTIGEDINLNSVAIAAGGIIRITSGTLTAGNA